MDVLSDILGTLRLKGTLYFTTEFRRPWGLRVPRYGTVARFHMVVRGSCWVEVVGEKEPVLLEAGDLILIPNGAEHVLTDEPGTPCRTVDEVVEAAGFTGVGALVYGGEDAGGPTRLVCGHFELDDGLHGLLARVPAVLIARWDEEVRDSPLEHAFRFITGEVQAGRPGHAAVVKRLSEVLFVQMIRAWADRSRHERGVLAALSDARLGAALAAIHAEPEARWTLDGLGRRAAMSRTAFAERFREVVGETPLQYLTRWRMLRAKRLLAESSLSLARIASRAGYDSAASFSRVFKKVTGQSPGAYRRAVRSSVV